MAGAAGAGAASVVFPLSWEYAVIAVRQTSAAMVKVILRRGDFMGQSSFFCWERPGALRPVPIFSANPAKVPSFRYTPMHTFSRFGRLTSSFTVLA